jgi:hypothetical protein
MVVRRTVQTLLSDPLTSPINRPPGDSLREESSAFITAHRVIDTFAPHLSLTHLLIFPVFGIE